MIVTTTSILIQPGSTTPQPNPTHFPTPTNLPPEHTMVPSSSGSIGMSQLLASPTSAGTVPTGGNNGGNVVVFYALLLFIIMLTFNAASFHISMSTTLTMLSPSPTFYSLPSPSMITCPLLFLQILNIARPPYNLITLLSTFHQAPPNLT